MIFANVCNIYFCHDPANFVAAHKVFQGHIDSLQRKVQIKALHVHSPGVSENGVNVNPEVVNHGLKRARAVYGEHVADFSGNIVVAVHVDGRHRYVHRYHRTDQRQPRSVHRKSRQSVDRRVLHREPHSKTKISVKIRAHKNLNEVKMMQKMKMNTNFCSLLLEHN